MMERLNIVKVQNINFLKIVLNKLNDKDWLLIEICFVQIHTKRLMWKIVIIVVLNDKNYYPIHGF